MSASATDKFKKLTNNFSTTLSSAIVGASDTTMSLASTTNLPTDTGVILVIDRVNSSGTATPSQREYVKGVVSGSNVINLVRGLGNSTAQAHSTGAVVEQVVDQTTINDIVDGILAQHNQDGTHGDVTATSVTTDTIKGKTASTLAIKDTSSNEYIKFSKTASAVNEVTVTNAATGNAPQISATGDDTNVDLRLVPKGTGNIKRGTSGGAIDWWEELGRTTLGSAGDTISVTGLSARKYLRILISGIQSGSIQASIQFNGDTGSNYSRNTSGANGAAFSASGSQTSALFTGAGVVNQWVTLDLMNISAQEKIGHYLATEGTTGAANAPNYRTGVIKWANTAAQITRVDVINVSTGDFAIGSEVVVLGHD